MRNERRRRSAWVAALVLGLAVAPTAQAQNQPKSGGADPFKDMALEQLLKIEIKSVAALTQTDSRRVPVAITELSARELGQSGFTDLNHALEAVVPNTQFIDHHHLQPHLGMRGVISDREDKYLFQVNGRTMNDRMLMGADNERALPMLGDIQSVTVVRGPASATLGAGAVAGAIGLQTYTGLTFQGFDANVRGDVVNQFAAGEFRYGTKFNDHSGLFAYYGIADQPGASNSDAPYFYGHSYPATNGLPAYVAGQPVAFDLANFHAPGFDKPRQKAHLSLVGGPFELWARFVQDGAQDRPLREVYTTARPDSVPLSDWLRGRQFLNQQFTVAGTLKKAFSPHWNADAMVSYDNWWLRDLRMGTQVTAPATRHGGESEYYGKAIATWSPTPAHSLAFGTEFSHEMFRDPYYSDALDRPPVVPERNWDTNTTSFLAEYQWKTSDKLTIFASARTDKHTYSDWLFSPRGTIVWTPNDLDTVKLMAGRSLRRGGDEELWSQYYRNTHGSATGALFPDPEKLTSYELSYDRKVGDSWHLGLHGFYEDYEAIGWVPALYYSTSIGDYKIAGGEFLLTFNAAGTRITFSEGISKLTDSSIPASLPPAGQAITAEPYGFGHDLAEWAPSITKLSVLHDFGRRVTASTSFVYYSGFPGAQDFADYAATLPAVPSAMPMSDPGFTVPYGPNAYWNVGLEYRPADRLVLRVDGYNLVDLWSQDLSKRNFYFRLSEYNVQPASLGLSLRYRF